MPTFPGSRGSSGTTRPERLSWTRIGRTVRQLSGWTGRAEGYGARVTTRGVQQRTADVERAFRSLPDRYLGAPAGFDATFHIVLGDVGRSWEVRCTPHGARVRAGATRRTPDVTIGTDSATWLALREGELSGIEAFSRRRLSARGGLDLAVAFEGLFRLPNGRPPLLHVHDVPVGRSTVSTLTMGEGPDVLLLHGLGSSKMSFLDTAADLSRSGYRVHALDLPGFGSSSKAPAPYGAPFFARSVIGVMDALGLERAHLVGNSMGGRVALEVGLEHPDRVGALALLCPAVAFVRRGWHPIVRLLRPELGVLPHSLGRRRIEQQFWSMFADRDQVDPILADVVVDEFERVYRTAGRPAGVPRVGAGDLPRRAVRAHGLLHAAGRPAPARPVRVVLPRQADPRRACGATWSGRCRRRSTCCWSTAATCRRSSARTTPTASSGASSPTPTRWARARRGGGCAASPSARRAAQAGAAAGKAAAPRCPSSPERRLGAESCFPPALRARGRPRPEPGRRAARCR